MPPNHGKHRSMRLGQSHGALAAFKVGANRDDARYAGCLRAFDQAWNFRGKIRECEMRVCVVERFHAVRAMCPAGSMLTIVAFRISLPLQDRKIGACCFKSNNFMFAKKTTFLRASLYLLAMALVPNAAALEITTAMRQGRDFQQSIFGGKTDGYVFPRNQHWDPKKAPNYSRGYAEFAVHDFQLTPAMIYTVNYGLAGLIKSHQQVFKRQVDRNFRVRFRIFGKFEDYAEYSRVRYRKKVSKNLLGFFSPSTNEIVSWKQEPHLTWRLVPTLLHEGCHTIMDEMFGVLPFWMVEGSADWLGEAPAWLQKADGLRRDQHVRWIRLDDMRKRGELPDLRVYLLTKNYGQWEKMFDGNIGTGYDIGWSIFDFFMTTHPQSTVFLGKMVNDPAVLRGRHNGQMEAAFAQAIDRNWQGGIKLLEKGWHTWIKRKSDIAKNALRQERAKRRR